MIQKCYTMAALWGLCVPDSGQVYFSVFGSPALVWPVPDVVWFSQVSLLRFLLSSCQQAWHAPRPHLSTLFVSFVNSILSNSFRGSRHLRKNQQLSDISLLSVKNSENLFLKKSIKCKNIKLSSTDN